METWLQRAIDEGWKESLKDIRLQVKMDRLQERREKKKKKKP